MQGKVARVLGTKCSYDVDVCVTIADSTMQNPWNVGEIKRRQWIPGSSFPLLALCHDNNNNIIRGNHTKKYGYRK